MSSTNQSITDNSNTSFVKFNQTKVKMQKKLLFVSVLRGHLIKGITVKKAVLQT